MDVFNLINGALFNVAKGANGKVEKVISTWDEFLNFELLHIGGFKLMSGSLIIVILMIIGTWIAVKLLRRIITRKGSETTKAQEAKRHTLFIIIKYVIWLASIIIMFEVIGIQVTLFLFGATAFLVTIGLGLQNIFRDIFSGMVMLFEETVQVGDIIEVNGEVGQVVEISLRSTEILTRDQVTLIMPNSKFIEEQVTNWTHLTNKVRFNVNVGVAYDSDIDQVIKLLEECMSEDPAILETPTPFIRFTDFGESSLDMELNFWSNEAFLIENVKSDLRKRVFHKLRENNVRIPFPQRDVRVYKENGRSSLGAKGGQTASGGEIFED